MNERRYCKQKHYSSYLQCVCRWLLRWRQCWSHGKTKLLDHDDDDYDGTYSEKAQPAACLPEWPQLPEQSWTNVDERKQNKELIVFQEGR